jgi:hypothetical protein
MMNSHCSLFAQAVLLGAFLLLFDIGPALFAQVVPSPPAGGAKQNLRLDTLLSELKSITLATRPQDRPPLWNIESSNPSPWQWLNPFPQANLLEGIWTFNADTISVAIGTSVPPLGKGKA